MRRFGPFAIVFAVILSILGVLEIRAPARADGLCANQAIVGLAVGQLVNANLQCDASGNLKVVSSGAATTFPYTYTGAQVPVAASFLGLAGFDGTNVRALSTTTTGNLNVVCTSGCSAAGGNPNGQALMAASAPVTIASNQSTLAVSGTVSAVESGVWNITAGTGFPTLGTAGAPSANVLSVQGISGGTPQAISGTVSLSSGTVSLSSGAATIGVVNAGTGFPTSGTAGVPSTNVVSVQGVAGGTAQPISGTVTIANSSLATTGQVSNTGTPSTVAVTTTVASVLPINANRVSVLIYSLPTSGATVLIGLGFPATNNQYSVAIVPGAYFELPLNFKGTLSAIDASGTATLLVTEFT